MLLGEIEVLKKAQIRVGSIFRMEFYPKDRVMPKGEQAIGRTKYFVIVGVDAKGNYVGVSLINTNVNIISPELSHLFNTVSILINMNF